MEEPASKSGASDSVGWPSNKEGAAGKIGPPKEVSGRKNSFEMGIPRTMFKITREIKKKRNFQKSFRKKFKKIRDFFELFGPKIDDFGAALKKVFDP